MKKTVGGTAALAYALKVARKMGISPSLQAINRASNNCIYLATVLSARSIN